MKKYVILLLTVAVCLAIASCHNKAASDSGGVSASPAPASTAQASVATGPEYKAVNSDYFGVIGEQKLYNYYLTCIYRARVEEFIKKQHDYDEELSIEEYFDFVARVLSEQEPVSGKTNREILQEKSLQECMYMAVMQHEAAEKNIRLSDAFLESMDARWKKYADQYYVTLNGRFSYVQSVDTAMELMTGGNVNEVIDYMNVQTIASRYASDYFYHDTSDNRNFAKYYQDHIDDFRRVTVRAVYVKEKTQAEMVRKLMNDRPEHIANLSRAFNEDPKLAETNGLVTVTSDTYMVPEEVKEWAYRQTSDVTFYNHGNIEILQTSEGYYLVMCETVEEYDDDTGNAIYRAVGEAYKSQKLNAYLDDLLTRDEYKLTEYDYDKAVKAMDESFKI